MNDTIEKIGSSLVKHGPGNKLAYLMKLHDTDAPGIIDSLEQLADSGGYSKLFAKVPGWHAGRFVAAGYHLEAAIPYFYPGGGSVCFMAKYLVEERKVERQPQLVQEILAAAEKQQRAAAAQLDTGFAVRMAEAGDAAEMARFYLKLFPGKPFPFHDACSVTAAMKVSSAFFGVWKKESIAALSCIEVDHTSSSAELKCMAALPEHNDQGLALHLLQRMEEHGASLGVRSVFSVARAYSYPMNLTFARNGYSFGGTLTNNSSVNGNLESFNVWHKALPDDPRFAWSHLFEAEDSA